MVEKLQSNLALGKKQVISLKLVNKYLNKNQKRYILRFNKHNRKKSRSIYPLVFQDTQFSIPNANSYCVVV